MFPHHIAQGATTPPDQDTYTFVIAQNSFDWNLREKLGNTFVNPITVVLRVETGVSIQGLTPGTPALDLDANLPSGSTVRLFNNGYILGMGGEGGDGAALYDQGSGLGTGNLESPQPGLAGGNAVRGPGVDVDFFLTNGAGRIWGGGGGGGGGGASIDTNAANGGGGGGGAGGGRGGRGGRTGAFSAFATDGTNGSSGPDGVNGTAGVGDSAGAAAGSNGGGGGDWGAAGTAGVSNSVYPTQAPGGTGGAAGKAVDLNGGTITINSGASNPNLKGAVS